MASDSSRESKESLLQEIQRLEKEKEELERRNREKQLLEQKLKELRGSVNSLRSSDSLLASTPIHETSASISPGISSLSGGRRDSGIFAGDSNRRDVDSSLQEIRDSGQAQHLQDRLFGSPTSAHSQGASRSSRKKDESTESSGSDSEKGDDVMSAKHKQAIQANRGVLVESMLPDDIFNDLISHKILTTPDVSRIKEKNTREAINEELLTILCRRSDRAFYVFVKSLRKTLQEYLANKIDPQPLSKSGKKKRKRQKGEVNISVDCEEVEPISPPRHSQRTSHSNTRKSQRQRGGADPEVSSGSCSCQEVEEQILRMAKEAYRNIRRRDATPAAFEQFRKELQQTNTVVKESMEIMHTLKILCRHGDISGISEGSIILTLRCHSASSAQELWNMYKSGKLQALIEKGFVTQSLKNLCRVRRVVVRVGMVKREYQRCLMELSRDENKARSLSSHLNLRSRKRRRTCENCDSSAGPGLPAARPHPRKAFQEILGNQVPVCNMPSKSASDPMASIPTSVPSACLSLYEQACAVSGKGRSMPQDLLLSTQAPSKGTEPYASCESISSPTCPAHLSSTESSSLSSSPSCVFVAAPDFSEPPSAVLRRSLSPSYIYIGLQNFSSGSTIVGSPSASRLSSTSSSLSASSIASGVYIGLQDLTCAGSKIISPSSCPQGSVVSPCAKVNISTALTLPHAPRQVQKQSSPRQVQKQSSSRQVQKQSYNLRVLPVVHYR